MHSQRAKRVPYTNARKHKFARSDGPSLSPSHHREHWHVSRTKVTNPNRKTLPDRGSKNTYSGLGLGRGGTTNWSDRGSKCGGTYRRFHSSYRNVKFVGIPLFLYSQANSIKFVRTPWHTRVTTNTNSRPQLALSSQRVLLC